MSAVKDGGAAFPVLKELRTEEGRTKIYHATSADGMSLRDWFAGQALAGLLADPSIKKSASDIAKLAYHLADAMLLRSTPPADAGEKP